MCKQMRNWNNTELLSKDVGPDVKPNNDLM